MKEIFMCLAEILHKNIDKNKISESYLAVGSLSVYFAENKGILHKFIYSEFTDLQAAFQNSLVSVNFLNLSFLRDKKEVLSKIERLIANIDSLM